jgi:ATP-dependent exoDNAse (exonuclease V) beta subunit
MAQQQSIPEFSAAQLEFLKTIAFTPDKMAMLVQEMKRPYVDQAQLDREKRENQKTKDDFKLMQEAAKKRQSLCRHQDKKGQWKINLIHNFPDGLPRGVCTNCDKFFHPAHWDFRASGPFQIPADPQYNIVLEIESQSFAEYGA